MPTTPSVNAPHAPSSSMGPGSMAPDRDPPDFRPPAATRGRGTPGTPHEGALHEVKAVAIALLVVLAAVAVWAGALVVGVQLSVWLTPRPLPPGHPAVVALPPEPLIDAEVAIAGRDLYMTSCALCHAADGGGRSGLGTSLARSDFVAARNDSALVQFVVTGRAADAPDNTMRMPMPPKGGNDALTETDIGKIVAYLRGLQDPRRVATLPPYTAPVAAPPTADEKAAALVAAGGDLERAEWIASGTRLYAANCLACHGAHGVGIAGVGMALRNNDFITARDDDDDLLEFLLTGRMPSAPDTKLGLLMPAKGGNPALDEDDLLDIIAYLRTIQNLTD